MCGIVGCININAGLFEWERDQSFFRNMLNVQGYRGPDDQGVRGFYLKENINEELQFGSGFYHAMDGMIGFNRLSIRDLSKNGHQPMTDRKCNVILAFNGEIYNAEQFYNELIAGGYQFQGHSDTEVILQMYLAYGIDALQKLNGMFAITIVDLRKGSIYLVRDRFGIKPLYYYMQNGRLFWASEYKSFLQIPGFVSKMNKEVLNEYIIFQSSPNRVLLEGIEQLKPGEILTVCNKEIRKNKFYDIDCLVHPQIGRSIEENMKYLDELLQKVISRQMVSDVKVGCQLSGGVDSSLVSYYACTNKEYKMEDSVSVIFNDLALNEEQYIDIAAQKLRLNSHKYDLNTDYLIKELKRTIWHLEALPTHPNSIALLRLTHEAKRDVSVLLSGEGADEVFGGYPEYVRQYFVQQYLERETVHDALKDDIFRRKEWFGEDRESAGTYAVRSGIIISPGDAAELFGMEADLTCIMNRYHQFESFTGNFFDKMVKYQMATYLPELLLRQDKMSMANSIENRVPLLDNEIVNFAFELPYEQLIHFNQGRSKYLNLDALIAQTSSKYILKRICGEKFGREFAFRAKGGFGLPLKYYFASKEFYNFFYEEILPPMKKRNFLDAELVERLYQRLIILGWREIELLWKAICTEVYMQVFL